MKRSIVAWTVLVIAAFTVWLFWPCTENEFLQWDDSVYLERAMADRTFTLERIGRAFTTTYFLNYHPLTTLSHALDCRLWGLNPRPHHAVNVLLHAANVGLLAMLLWELLAATKAFSSREQFAVTTGVALAFAVHPMQVETVAWVAERKALLCATFSLGCLYAYVRRARVSTLVLFALALLSKPTAAPLPVVMLLLDVYPLGWRGKLLREKLPLFAMSAAIAAVAVWAQAAGQATMTLDRLSVPARCLVAARGAVFYIWKLVWPVELSPYYPLEGIIALRQWEFALLCALITFVAIWRRREWPALFAGWLGYLVLIAPTSGLVQMGGQAAADRYVYLAMVPVLLGIAWGIVWLWRRFKKPGRLALAALLLCQLAFFAFRTRGQTFVWHNDETMWRSVLTQFPKSGLANQGLAQVLLDQERTDEALECAQRAVEVAPWVAAAHGVLARAYLQARRYEDAAGEAERALRLDRTLPDPHYVLACAYTKQADYEKAFENLRVWLVARPGLAAYATTAAELAELREHPQFRERFQQLVTPK